MFEKTKAKRAARRANGEKGFTLIELLATVTVIGILGTIGTAVVINQTEKASEAALRSELNSVREFVKGGLVATNPDIAEEFANKSLLTTIAAGMKNGASVWDKTGFSFVTNKEGTAICVEYTEDGKTYAMDAAEAQKTGPVKAGECDVTGGTKAGLVKATTP